MQTTKPPEVYRMRTDLFCNLALEEADVAVGELVLDLLKDFAALLDHLQRSQAYEDAI